MRGSVGRWNVSTSAAVHESIRLACRPMGRNRAMSKVSSTLHSRSVSTGRECRTGRTVESMKKSLVELVIDRFSWEEYRIASGPAGNVPEVLKGLVEAEAEDQAEGYYWELENEVVVQGQLFSSAVPVVSVILAALTGATSQSSRSWLLELLS